MRVSAVFAVWFCSAIPVLLRKNVDNSAQHDQLLSLLVLGERHTLWAMRPSTRVR